MILGTRGIDSELSSVAFTIANGGITAGLKVSIFLTCAAVDLVRRGGQQLTHVPPLDPLAGLIADFQWRGGMIWACRPCVVARGYEQRDLVDGVEIVGASVMDEEIKHGAATCRSDAGVESARIPSTGGRLRVRRLARSRTRDLGIQCRVPEGSACAAPRARLTTSTVRRCVLGEPEQHATMKAAPHRRLRAVLWPRRRTSPAHPSPRARSAGSIRNGARESLSRKVPSARRFFAPQQKKGTYPLSALPRVLGAQEQTGAAVSWIARITFR